jgi:hypothetical protein
MLNNEPHPNYTPITNSNLEPPNPKTLSNQPHTADDALVILATTHRYMQAHTTLSILAAISQGKHNVIDTYTNSDANNFKKRPSTLYTD